MKQIRLTPATIKAIAEFINATEVFDSYTKVRDAEFEQGKNTIYVDYNVTADYVEDQNVHNEFGYNNIEDLSCWIACDVELLSVTAFNEDGDELQVREKDFEAIHQALAVA